MGFFSGWRQKQREKSATAQAPYIAARNAVWEREAERLGEAEFALRLRSPAEYAEWHQALNAEIQAAASGANQYDAQPVQTKPPERQSPATVGAFVGRYIYEKVRTSSPTSRLRDLLDEGDVSPEKRDTFDEELFLFAVFVAFVAARRIYPAAVAEAILRECLRLMLSQGTREEISAVQHRLADYREYCSDGLDPGAEVAALTSIGCAVLYDRSDDLLFTTTVSPWVMMYLKTFSGGFADIGSVG